MGTVPSRRIAWIDTAKLVSIFLVILGHLLSHCDESAQFIGDVIYILPVQLFMFLSALVEKPRPPRETLARSVRGLLVPYVWFYALNYAYWFAVSRLRHLHLVNVHTDIIMPFLGMLLGCGYKTAFTIMITPALWFLPALFWCKMMNSLGNTAAGSFARNDSGTESAETPGAPSVYTERADAKRAESARNAATERGTPGTRAQRRWATPALCAAGVAIAVALWCWGKMFLPFSLGPAFIAFPFFYAGVALKESARGARWLSGDYPLPVKLAVFAVCGAATVLFVWLDGRADINLIRFGRNPVWFYAGSFTGIAALCVLSQMLPHLHAPGNLLAQNTLTILAFHGIIYSALLKVYARVFLHTRTLGDATLPFPALCAVALATLLACAVPCFIISRFFPFMLGKPTKKTPRPR